VTRLRQIMLEELQRRNPLRPDSAARFRSGAFRLPASVTVKRSEEERLLRLASSRTVIAVWPPEGASSTLMMRLDTTCS
jgi:hypothetical protein